MKKVEAIIKPYLLEDVRESLQTMGHTAMTVSEIRRYIDLHSNGIASDDFSDPDFSVDYLPRLKIEVVVQDEQAEEAVSCIQNVSGGDSIVVQDITGVVRIRTNERDAVAV
ncbi:MAG: P-II family nitrogen regulator [Verrucomicrobiota bacterium]